jgi:hypothetical protein
MRKYAESAIWEILRFAGREQAPASRQQSPARSSGCPGGSSRAQDGLALKKGPAVSKSGARAPRPLQIGLSIRRWPLPPSIALGGYSL